MVEGEPMHPAVQDLGARVRAQYEAYPYPRYSLLLPLRSQEAYASNSLFAARLLESRGLVPAVREASHPGILLAGCGDVFPYMATFWEPRAHRLIAADLSAGSLRRARLRCLPRLRSLDWRRGSLEDAGFDLPGGLSHIDCYGVLHHLANPAAVLGRLAGLLLPGGTARIMVYNSAARTWIRHLQRGFDLLGLAAHGEGDVAAARGLLESLAAASPALRERLSGMGESLANPARLVDTFLHAREARLGLGFWLGALAAGGFRLLGLFDRYGELDDLPSPLLEPPEPGDLEDRIADRRFENNLELFLMKPGPASGAAGRGLTRRLPSPLVLRTPPLAWSAYSETRGLPGLVCRRLWIRFLRRLSGHVPAPADSWAGRLPPAALQRLGRLGVLLPDDVRSRELQDLLRRPLHASMEAPVYPPPIPLRDHGVLRGAVLGILWRKGLPEARLDLVLRRFEAAQIP